MSGTGRRKKWSGGKIQERQELAAQRRRIQKEPSAVIRRTMELAISCQVIDKRFLEAESHLTQTRWVEYGYLSPLECTEIFCRMYLSAYQRYYEKYRDSSKASDRKPVDPELFKNDHREINSLWHARQIADEIGMPYDMYINATMDWAASQKNRQQFPQPNQLIHPKQLEVALVKWENLQGTVNWFGDNWDDRFFDKLNPKFDPPRQKALRLVIEKMKRSSSPEFTLASLMGRWDVLTEKAAKHIADTVFPNKPDLMDEAKRHLMPPRKVRAVPTDPYLAPCLGMREDVTAGVCGQCSFALLCQKVRLVSGKLMHASTGSSDPRADKKRQNARERQRRKRDRDRAARGVLVPMMEAG